MAAENPKNLKYTKDHEWARKEGANVVVGVTHHAQEALGDLVLVELPKVGATVTAGAAFGVLESTKAVSDLFAPITGKVTKVNSAAVGDPSLVNREPYGGGWLIEVAPTNAADVDALLDAPAYDKLLASA